jgi:GH43 family beta-xylosidase
MRRAIHLTAALAAAAMLASGTAAVQTEATCPGPSASGVAAREVGVQQSHLLWDQDFPDPFVARFGGAYHGYATGVQGLNVQYTTARSLTGWSAPREALPAANFPAWVDRAHPQVWAPEVAAINGRYVLYFNARHRSLQRTELPAEAPRVLQRHCLGAAVAASPAGPFTGLDEPLVCTDFADGVIDAGIFSDGAAHYLYYKDDANCCGRGSAIFVQPLTADGLTPLGRPIRLHSNNDSPGPEDDWEWRVVEAPTMVKRGGAYFLFFSGNFFGNKNYSVGYLRCASPIGPCRDLGDNPILHSFAGSPLIGPGHQAVLEENGRSLLFFHGWNREPQAGDKDGLNRRCLYAARIDWTAEPDVRPRIPGGKPTQAR